jgi:hypothetical protein
MKNEISLVLIKMLLTVLYPIVAVFLLVEEEDWSCLNPYVYLKLRREVMLWQRKRQARMKHRF